MKVEPISQSIEAVKGLLAFLGRSTEPLPESIEIRNAVLVLSAKKDVYYAVTPVACSCPAFTYHPGKSCKHQRKYFGDMDSLKPVANWPQGCHGFVFD